MLEKPKWLKVRPPHKNTKMQETIQRLKKLNLATVCQSARCPNMAECWSTGTATIMVMGDTCTRACKFCNVKTGMPDKLDPLEPQKTAFAIKQMDIDYVVITSVDRDELLDQGANHLKKVIEMVRRFNPDIKIEILAPDLRGKVELLKIVLAAKPKVYAHNIETVRRLTPQVRDIRATYQNSLNILKQAKQINPVHLTKTSIMLGLGETPGEVLQTLSDLRKNDCDIITFGQYMQPSPKHYRVQKYVPPQDFLWYTKMAYCLGFKLAYGGPLVRSSYKAGQYFKQLQNA